MSRQRAVAHNEELRELRIRHAKSIERSAKILVDLETSNEADREVLRSKDADAHTMHDSVAKTDGEHTNH